MRDVAPWCRRTKQTTMAKRSVRTAFFFGEKIAEQEAQISCGGSKSNLGPYASSSRPANI